jgi:hypothetical protein
MQRYSSKSSARAVMLATIVFMLGARLGGTLHVYDLDSHFNEYACELCVHYSSSCGGLPAAAIQTADHGAAPQAPFHATFPVAVPRASPQLTRGPPSYS